MKKSVTIFTGHNKVVAKVMFLQVSVCSQGGRVSASVHAGMPDPPQTRQTPPISQTPLGPGRPPRDQPDPPPPRNQAEPPTPGEADSSIRSTSGRYASYWNAFLFFYFFPEEMGDVVSEPGPTGPTLQLQPVT